jgi:succinyl-CoA synthetase beta subunit
MGMKPVPGRCQESPPARLPPCRSSIRGLHGTADASLAEINPFIFTPEGKGLAIDAKVNLDDNAHVPASRVTRNCVTWTEEDPAERRRSRGRT